MVEQSTVNAFICVQFTVTTRQFLPEAFFSSYLKFENKFNSTKKFIIAYFSLFLLSVAIKKRKGN